MMQIQLVVCIPMSMEQIRAESMKAQLKNGFSSLRLTWEFLPKYGCVILYIYSYLNF